MSNFLLRCLLLQLAKLGYVQSELQEVVIVAIVIKHSQLGALKNHLYNEGKTCGLCATIDQMKEIRHFWTKQFMRRCAIVALSIYFRQ